MSNLKVNGAFRDLLPVMRPEERNLLEQSLEQEGQRDPVIVWKEKGFILDGHNRAEILGSKTRTQEISLPNEAAAELWIINNQLGRRNLHANHYAYYLGKKYEKEKQQEGGDRKSPRQNGEVKGETRARIAKETGESQRTIERNAAFAKGVDKLDAAQPGIKSAILNGRTNLGKGEIEAIGKVADVETKKVAAAIKGGKPLEKAVREAIKPKVDPWKDVYCFVHVIEATEALAKVKIKQIVAFLKDTPLGRSHHKGRSLTKTIRLLLKLEKTLRKEMK